MTNIHLNLTIRLNYLIGLLDISSQQSYEKIKGHKILDEFDNVGEIYNNQYSIYRNQITTSAFLLGYAYFEAFLSDLIIICLTKNPKILIPEGKTQIKDKTITYNQLLLAEGYDQLIKELIEKEVRNIMYKSMSEILEYLDRKLKLTWDKSLNSEIIVAKKIRNCCMHNNCLADKGLAKDPRFTEGVEIELTSGSVHSFGLKARQFSRELWESAKIKYPT
ncbi:MAG TPA: hypothetical protein PKC69_00510 [Chitinophagaceae bacterium]|nr:hypothetical protein [Chitinophagaceae bacterium]